MKKIIPTLIAALMLALAPGVSAESAKEDIKKAAKHTGRAAKKTGKKIGHATRDAAKEVGHGFKRAFKKVEKDVKD